MPRVTVDPDTAQDVVEYTARLYGTFAICVGLVTVVGGRDRWAAQAYETALSVPGAPTSWGVVFAAFGVLLLVGALRGSRWAVGWGSLLCAVWCVFFAVTFVLQAVRHDAVGLQGPLVWGMFGVLFMIRAVISVKR